MKVSFSYVLILLLCFAAAMNACGFGFDFCSLLEVNHIGDNLMTSRPRD